MYQTELNAAGISLRSYAAGNHKTTCPQCSHRRKDKSDPCLSITIKADGAVWKCHNACGFDGGTKTTDYKKASMDMQRPYTKPKPIQGTVSSKLHEFMTNRGISAEVYSAHGVDVVSAWMPNPEGNTDCMAFRYRKESGGDVVNIKYRTFTKQFRQEKDAEKIFYGMDTVPLDATSLIIVEGEMDVLACNMAGIWNVVSVPDGAPATVQEVTPTKDEDRKFSYVWNCHDWLKRFSTYVLAVDSDNAGRCLAEELAIRLGRNNCKRVNWREPDAKDGPKDANDTLMQDSAEAIVIKLNSAQYEPVKGVVTFSDIREKVYMEMHGQYGDPTVPTGMPGMDDKLRLGGGCLMVLSGYPQSGKSTWMNNVIVSTNLNHGWKWAICGLESDTVIHMTELAHIMKGGAFALRPMDYGTYDADYAKYGEMLEGNFYFFSADDDDQADIMHIINTASILVERYGVKGLFIDPYNCLDHKRNKGEMETDYISRLLTYLRRFAVKHNVLVCIAAHPKKPEGDMQDEPSLYDINGSANWFNKCDLGVILQRVVEGGVRTEDVQVCVGKAKLPRFGKVGKHTVKFNWKSKNYENTY